MSSRAEGGFTGQVPVITSPRPSVGWAMLFPGYLDPRHNQFRQSSAPMSFRVAIPNQPLTRVVFNSVSEPQQSSDPREPRATVPPVQNVRLALTTTILSKTAPALPSSPSPLRNCVGLHVDRLAALDLLQALVLLPLRAAWAFRDGRTSSTTWTGFEATEGAHFSGHDQVVCYSAG